MQGQVQWPELMAIISMITGSGVMVAGFVVWLWSKMASADREYRKAIDELREALNTTRVEIAEKYVTIAALAKVEVRIEAVLSSMAAQFERGFDRLTDLISKKHQTD